jgi:hypothetical protein
MGGVLTRQIAGRSLPGRIEHDIDGGDVDIDQRARVILREATDKMQAFASSVTDSSLCRIQAENERMVADRLDAIAQAEPHASGYHHQAERFRSLAARWDALAERMESIDTPIACSPASFGGTHSDNLPLRRWWAGNREVDSARGRVTETLRSLLAMTPEERANWKVTCAPEHIGLDRLCDAVAYAVLEAMGAPVPVCSVCWAELDRGESHRSDCHIRPHSFICRRSR